MTNKNDIAEFEKIAADTLSTISSYIQKTNQKDSPASGYAPMREILQKLDVENYMQNGGMNRESFKIFLANYLENSVQIHSPSFIAHQVSVPDSPSILSGMINSVMNNPMAIYEMGPAAATLEFRVVNWMLEKIGCLILHAVHLLHPGQEDRVANSVKGSTEVKHHQQPTAIAIHGTEQVIGDLQ